MAKTNNRNYDVKALDFITSEIGKDFYICLEGEMRR